MRRIKEKKMRSNFKILFLNLFSLLLAVFFAFFLKQASLAGVVLLIGAIIISLFFDARVGFCIGLINLLFALVIMLFYFQLIQKPIEWRHFLGTLPLFLLGGYLAGKYNEMKRKYALELEKRVAERTKELREAKKKLEETNKILEIRVRARTRELRELAESLEEKVKERTKELERKINELERFHRLAVGRELKMIELKKEIKQLKIELEKAKGRKT